MRNQSMSRPRRRLNAEILEDRRMLATFVVSSAADSGSGTLREAIQLANSNNEGDLITFESELSGARILLSTGQLDITDTLTIDATSLDSKVTIDALQQGRIFNIDDDGDDFWNFDVAFSGLELTGGETLGNGGAIQSFATGLLTLEEVTIVENSVSDPSRGGGVYLQRGRVVVTDSQIMNNRAGSGGGIYSRAGSVIVTRSSISHNSSVIGGGGVVSASGQITIDGSQIIGNHGGNGPGGISGAVVVIDSSSINHNRTSGDTVGINVAGGGGIRATTVWLTNSTVSGNTAEGHDAVGGGVQAETISITSSTVAYNSATTGGGIYADDSLVVINSIIAGNRADLNPELYLAQNRELRITFSLIGDNSGTGTDAAPIGSPSADGNLIGSAIEPINAGLAPLEDEIHRLSAGSPALDAGDSTLEVDQEGAMRPVEISSAPNYSSGNGADMGAVEFQEISDTFVPTDLVAIFDVESNLDLSAILVAGNPEQVVTTTLTADAGTFGVPADGSEFSVNALLTDDQTITLSGTAVDLNRYFDVTSHVKYTPPLGAAGNDATLINVSLVEGGTAMSAGRANVDVAEPPSLDVTTSSDVVDRFDFQTSLREAIQLANLSDGPDTITIVPDVSGQTMTLEEGALWVQDSLSIDANEVAENVVIDARNLTRVFRISDPMRNSERLDVEISGLTMINGNTSGGNSGGGGIYFDGNALALDRVQLLNNSAGRTGGGGVFLQSGSVSLKESMVRGNSSEALGGAGIHAFNGSVSILNSVISQNSSTGRSSNGGGIRARYEVSILDSAIQGNFADGSGGGISSAESVTIVGSSVDANISQNGIGGGIVAGRVTVRDSTISGNKALNYSGGGIVSSDTSIVNSTLSGNSAQRGGGLLAYGPVSIQHSTVTRNMAEGGQIRTITIGGGVWLPDELGNYPVSIHNSIIAENIADRGADLHLDPDSDQAIAFSLVGDNQETSLQPTIDNEPDSNGNYVGSSDRPLNPRLAPLGDNGGRTFTHALLHGGLAIDSANPAAIAGQDVPIQDQRGEGFARIVNGRMDIGAIELQSEAIDGDFDGDGDHDCQDVDLLSIQIVNGSNNLEFDVDGNGRLDLADISSWLVVGGAINNDSGQAYLPGDANLDGSVDVADFNRWNDNQFTQTIGWCSGDFNTDGVVDVSDFNAWNEHKFLSSDTAAPGSQGIEADTPRRGNRSDLEGRSIVEQVFREWKLA